MKLSEDQIKRLKQAISNLETALENLDPTNIFDEPLYTTYNIRLLKYQKLLKENIK